MAERTPRRARVLETRPLTPQMIRVVLGGPELEGFGAGAFTDHYVKLRITPPGASEPRTRTYTVRDWDAERGQLTIDFVHHGDAGVAGPWAAAARPVLIEVDGPEEEQPLETPGELHLVWLHGRDLLPQAVESWSSSTPPPSRNRRRRTNVRPPN